MSRPSYWLSASVLTITSAPSFSAASRPAWKPFARPLLFVSRTMWSTPFARATSMVRSVEPSSMTSHSTVVEAGHLAGEVAQRDRERLLLVQAGDLDDELHGVKGVKATIGAVMSRLRDEGPALAVLGLMMVAGLVLRRPPQRSRPALRLLRRRGLALHQARRRGLPRRESGLLPEPVGVHLPAAPRLPRRVAPVRAAGRRSSRATGIDRRMGLRDLARRSPPCCASPASARRLRRRAAAVGPPHRARRRRRALLRVPAGRLLAPRGDRRRDARARRGPAAALRSACTRAAGWRTCLLGGRRGRPGDRLQVHRRARAARARRSRSRCRCSPRRDRRGAARRRDRRARARRRAPCAAFFVTNPYFFLDLDTALHQLRGQAELAGNQDKFGQEGDTRRRSTTSTACSGGSATSAAPRPPAGAVLLARRDRVRLAILLDLPGRAVPLPERAVALLRPLAAAGLPGARAARGLRVRAGRSTLVRARAPRLEWPALAVGARAAAVAAARRRRALDGGARPRGHARDRAPVARRARPARAAGDHRAGGARALLLAGARRPARSGSRARSSSTSSSATSARTHVEYGRTLRPRVLDRYRAEGYCTVDDLRPDPRPRARRPATAPRSPTTTRSSAESDVDLPRSARTAPTPIRRRSASTSATATTRPPTSGPGPRCEVHRLRDCTQGYGPREDA